MLPVIEFDLQGNVLTANEQFHQRLGLLARRAAQACITASSSTRPIATPRRYRAFWDRLRARRDRSRRSTSAWARTASPLWVQATYYPILDAARQAVQGRQAHDQRHRADAASSADGAGPARGHQQGAGGHRVRHSTARCARPTTTSCALIGYSLEEVRGQHHSMFVDAGRARERRVSRVLGEARARRIRRRPVQARRQGRPRGLDSGQLQPDPRCERQAVQGREVRDRCDRAGAASPSSCARRSRETQAVVSGGGRRRSDASASRSTARPASCGALRAGVNALIEHDRRRGAADQDSRRRSAGSARRRSPRGNPNLSQRTEEQASSLEETASSMEEMATTVKQTADNAARPISSRSPRARRRRRAARSSATAVTRDERHQRGVAARSPTSSA